ncbi:SDR family oxidoreductase [Amycolatopsis sulphurea]|uniref:SDR family oxidoreductase n=1 Tax=Amycolatopsis sulphurea TaxID=76022 RepID=UPI001FE26C20|nr:SDR family oxidoreductase [Amycolatopsis sulphurea]
MTGAPAGPDTRVHHTGLDLAESDAPQRLVNTAVDAFAHIDIVVCNHARSGGNADWASWTRPCSTRTGPVSTRSTILLTRAFAARHDGRPGGRVTFLTSGQDLGPMRHEVAYAAGKGALASITRTLADHLADRAITVNPGPADTGYAPPDVHEAVHQHFPQGRWGVPDDHTDDAAWITEQTISTEGGFRRWN